MANRIFLTGIAGLTVLFALPYAVFGQVWNSPGLTAEQFKSMSSGGPAPRRDISGIWDAGAGGVNGAPQEKEREAARAPFTPLGEQLMSRNKPGNGSRAVNVAEINDPLSTMGDPTGFPRIVLYELRPFQVVQMPGQVLMLYMFEHRWRVIWTDGRQLPSDPDSRWYGYSVGRWEDDYTLVVETTGTDDRTWVDNSGDPHSSELHVTERYHRVNENTIELTVVIDDPMIYTKPWLGRDRLPMKRMAPGNDLAELIPAASDTKLYRDVISSQAK
jgi:hypothetical protein